MLSAIPVLNWLNCCFCLLNIAGVAIGLSMYLKANPTENITSSDAAGAGAISGATAGLISGIVGMIMNLIVGGIMTAMYRSLPPDVARAMAQSSAMGVGGIPVSIILYGAFGALGGVLSMQLFFKDRLAR